MASDRFFVKTLSLENFRCFEKAELGPFDPHFNLLVGTNGAGKSSVLLALANLIRPLAMTGGVLPSDRILNSGDNRLTPSPYAEGAIRSFLPSPWSISANFDWGGDTFVAQDIFGGQPSIGGQPTISRQSRESGQYLPLPAGFQTGEFAEESALLALFTVKRLFTSHLTGQSPVSPNNDKSVAFSNWLDAGTSSDALREWMRDQTLVSLQQGGLKPRLGLDNLTVPGASSAGQLKIVIDAIRAAVEGADCIEYSGQRKDIVVRFSDGRILDFSNMSDGQRALIGMVADIARRACLLNSAHFGQHVLTETSGLVLIDELDLHLHPRWQRRVIGDLKRIFPNIQFFATTHSPQVIGEARPEEIVLLTSTGQKRPMQSFGMDSNWVLECVMEAEGRDPEIARRIKSFFNAIEDGRFEEARGEISKLRKDIGEAPDIVGAESYLWNLEHSGDEAAE